MRKLMFVLLSITAVVWAGAVDGPHEAAALVLDELLDGDISERSILSLSVPVSAGEVVRTWTSSVTAPIDGWLVLVDDMALANWEHPCRWVFVSPEGSMEIVHMTTPPSALPRMSMEYTSLPEYTSSVRSDLLDWFVPNPRTDTAANCKALIISGGASAGSNHIRYYGDVQFIYLTLTEDYGYTNDDIIICFADGLNPAVDNSSGGNSNPDLDGDGNDDFDYDATLGSVTNALAEMATLAGPADHVLIYCTDHGGSGKDSPPEVYLNLWNSQTLNDDVFDTFIDTFDCASMHVIMEQCFSGGFLGEVVPAAGQEPRTFGSAATAYESSWAGTTYPDYDEWVYWWTGAMHGSVPAGGSLPGGSLPYDPDINTDGYVDYKEAWDAAFVWDTASETPQYDDDPDSCGSNYWLGGLIGSPGVGEGTNPMLPATGLSLLGNPVASVATLAMHLNTSGQVDIVVYDMTGHIVETLASGTYPAGEHSVSWTTDGLSSGIYMVRLTAGPEVVTLRAVKL